MNNTEAKFVLNAYRPSGRDATDATFGGALAQARADPLLGAWFARSQAHDAVMSSKVRAIGIPAGLRESILMGARVSGEGLAAKPAQRRWWAPWVAMAATVALLVTVGVSFWPKPAQAAPEEFAGFALDDLMRGKHGGHGAAETALQHWLSTTDVHFASATMPVDFATLEKTGCRVLAHHGEDVLEVCFQRGDSEYHLYIIRHEDLPEMPVRAAPAFIAKASGAAAVWSDAHFHYALVSDAGARAIRQLM